jgi:GT2 family glycosyltransferase
MRSAAPVVALSIRDLGLNIKYDVESIQNISLARNKAVLNSTGNFIAFIDDDEVPDKKWLLNLYKAIFHFKADAVLGPVLPDYKASPPRWVIEGELHKRPSYKTGYRIDWKQGRTGNILIRSEIFQVIGEPFNPIFGSGGEDQDFTRRAQQKGFTFIWCNDARAFEIISPIRWNRSFMIKRALLRGKMSSQYPESRFAMSVRALCAIPIYTMALPVLFILRYSIFMKYLIKIFDHTGRILSILNINAIESKYIT